MTIWAFAQVPDADARKLVYDSIRLGKSRFGCWGTGDLRENWDGKLAFLLSIKKGDWIVHINSPCWGKCVAVEVLGEYSFDNGLNCKWGTDFNNFVCVDTDSIIEFNRRDTNILPTVNLNPRSRYHRIHAKEDFFKSLDNLKDNKVDLDTNQSKELYHLKKKLLPLLGQITHLIHATHKSKNLERFFSKIFRNIPGVVEVIDNGFGWRTDNGADLIVKMQSSLANIEFEKTVIVQVKSYENDHNELNAVNQVVEGIEKYSGDAGLLLTTGNSTEQLETYIQKKSDEIGKPIDLIAGDDVAKFVMKYSNDLLFGV